MKTRILFFSYLGILIFTIACKENYERDMMIEEVDQYLLDGGECEDVLKMVEDDPSLVRYWSDPDGSTNIIFLFCKYGSAEEVESLYEMGADKDFLDNEGRSAGDIARARRRSDLLKLFSEIGVR